MHAGFSPFPELETSRLLLRRLSESDDHDLLKLRSDRAVNKFIQRPKMKGLGEVRNFILRIHKDNAEEKGLYWAISIAGDPKLIGVVCLWKFRENYRIAELGYELMPHFQKKGFMQEAVSRVIRYGFERIFLDRIEAFTHLNNKNSIRLLEKNGFSSIVDRTDPEYPSNIIFSLSRKYLQ
jgi:[ribosomal protein S5]-alanine N-acetyltransferase